MHAGFHHEDVNDAFTELIIFEHKRQVLFTLETQGYPTSAIFLVCAHIASDHRDRQSALNRCSSPDWEYKAGAGPNQQPKGDTLSF